MKHNDRHQVIARHASAQRSQASAHSLQCVWACFAHSAAHMSQALAQRAQISFMQAPSRAIDETHKRHISAHSKSSAMQFAIDFSSVSLRHAAAHCKQATALALQASRHAFWVSFIIFIILKRLSKHWVSALSTIGAKASVCQHTNEPNKPVLSWRFKNHRGHTEVRFD